MQFNAININVVNIVIIWGVLL